MIRLIIYDLDGTLIDSRKDITSSVNWTLKELGFKELPTEQISSFVGSGVANLMRQSLQEIAGADLCVCPGVAPTVLDRSIKLFRRYYGEHLLDQTQLYPSVRKVLEFFKDRKQSVITNKPQDFSVTILKGLGIDPFFFKVMGGDQGFPKKPHPAALLEIMKAAEAGPEETILVGDSATDIETGRNAGVKVAAVTYGFGSLGEIVAARPESILNDLEELMACPLLKI